MATKFYDTISAISVNAGIVKIHFAKQDDPENKQINGQSQPKFSTEQIVALPLPGFMYAVSIIQGLLNNPKMTAQIEKYIELGLLPQKTENFKNNGAGKPS